MNEGFHIVFLYDLYYNDLVISECLLCLSVFLYFPVMNETKRYPDATAQRFFCLPVKEGDYAAYDSDC